MYTLILYLTISLVGYQPLHAHTALVNTYSDLGQCQDQGQFSQQNNQEVTSYACQLQLPKTN